MRDPHQNIFYYYRGQSSRSESSFDVQIEDNTTKSLINTLELFDELGFNKFLDDIFLSLNIPKSKVVSFKLQVAENESRPDALIKLSAKNVYIESKVRAALDINQIKRHLTALEEKDVLLVITNHRYDGQSLHNLNDSKLKHITWEAIYKIALNIEKELTNNKNKSLKLFIHHFIEYLEVVTLTGFNGLREDDFNFLIDYNKHYLPILKAKMIALAEEIKKSLPSELKEYDRVRAGNIPKEITKDTRIWWAIKRDSDDVFNQCNYTVELSRDGFQINAVIRNSGIYDKKKPLGVFYDKLEDPSKFLRILRGIKLPETKIIFSERRPKTGARIMPGNEVWVKYASIDISKITTEDDVKLLRNLLEKVKKPNFPGVHINRFIERGNELLLSRDRLLTEITKTLIDYKPVLDFLRE